MKTTPVLLLNEDGGTFGTAELPPGSPPRPMVVSHAGRVFRFARADQPAVPAAADAEETLVYQLTPSTVVTNFTPAEKGS